MDFIEDLRVCEECAETGFCAEINCPAAIFCAREIGRIGVAEDPSAECDEARPRRKPIFLDELRQ